MKIISKQQLLKIPSKDPNILKIQQEEYIKKVSGKINEYLRGGHKERIKKFLNENNNKK